MPSRLVRHLLAVALIAAAPLHAQTAFTITDAGPASAFGYSVGPYGGTMGAGTSAQSLFMYCVDFEHRIEVGQEWNANLSNLGTGAGVGTDTRSSDLTRYRQAAWLTTQYWLHPDATADIQATIWGLFASDAPASPSGNYWLTQAQANYASLDYTGFFVVTDVNRTLDSSVQEFIVVTPEPASMVLLGTGLLLVLGIAGFRVRQRNALES